MNKVQLSEDYLDTFVLLESKIKNIISNSVVLIYDFFPLILKIQALQALLQLAESFGIGRKLKQTFF